MDANFPASNLPYDVQGLILENLAYVGCDRGPKADERRKLLSRLSLSCRYWARICRPLVFQCLTLHTREHLNKLIALIASDPQLVPPTLQQCLAASYVDTAEFTGPWSGFWVRLMSKKLPYHSGRRDLRYTLRQTYVPPTATNERSAELFAPRSWSASLPRTLPPSLFRAREVYLFHLRFRCIENLISLIGDVQGLQRVSCRDITFAEPFVPQYPSGTERGKDAAPIVVQVSNCESAEMDLDVALMILWRSTLRSAPNHHLDTSSWVHIRETIRSLLPSTWGKKHRLQLRIIPAQQDEPAAFEVAFRTEPKHTSHSLRFKWFDQWSSRDVASSRNGPAGIASMQAVFYGTGLPISKLFRSGEENIFNWQTFGEALLALNLPDGAHVTVVGSDAMYASLLGMFEKDRSKGSLARLHRSSKLELLFEFTAGGAGVTLEELTTLPAEYVIDGRSCFVGLQTRFELWRCLLADNGREVASIEQENRLRKCLQKVSGELDVHSKETVPLAQAQRHQCRSGRVQTQRLSSGAISRKEHGPSVANIHTNEQMHGLGDGSLSTLCREILDDLSLSVVELSSMLHEGDGSEGS